MDDQPSTLSAARALREAMKLATAGYQLTPVTITRRPSDGRKAARFHENWRRDSAWSSDPDRIKDWSAQHACSFAIRTGKAGGVDVVDLDGDEGILWWAEQGHPLGLMIVDTISGGLHSFVKACGLPTAAKRFAPHVDTRGDGGLVFAPGSFIPDEEGTYSIRGQLVPVAELTALPFELVGAIRAAKPETANHPTDGRTTRRDKEWMLDRTKKAVKKIEAMPLYTDGDEFRDAQMGAAMMLGRLVENGLCDDLETAWEIMEEATLKVWPDGLSDDDRLNIKKGLADGPRKERWEIRDPTKAASETSPSDAADEPSSWAPVDLLSDWDEDTEPEAATLLRRADGAHLVYPGRTHSIYGESESGKSWVALILAAQVLAGDGEVLYIDHESDARPIRARLRALGVTREQAKRLTYIRPDGPRDETWRALLDQSYVFAAIDGVSVAIATEGASSDSTDETARWLEEVPRALAVRTGAAVLTVDHVTKARDNRGRFAIGSQAKLNAISGAAYTARVHQPFGRGQVGELVLRITKDRPGGVRPQCGPAGEHGTQEAARIVLDATDPEHIKVDIKRWSEIGDEDTDLPFGDFREQPTSWRDVETPLPADIIDYQGQGRAALFDLARFMRHTATGGIGQSLADAKRELGALKDVDNKPLHNRWSVQRAWGALIDPLNRLQKADGVNADTGRMLWALRDGE